MYVNDTGPKTARYYGIKYRNNKLVSNKVERIKKVTKRGIWNYDIN